MSKIEVTISEIKSIDGLNIVEFDFNGISLKMMSLDLSSDISVGKRVVLVVKPTHIVLAKEFFGNISYSNQISAKVIECENGKLLSSIKLLVKDTIFESIITLDSALRMDINVNDEVTMLIKASELSIFEVLDD